MTNRLFDMASPCGAEDKIRNFLSCELSHKFDTSQTDPLGNLIFRKSGKGEKICIECGMGSYGIMVVSAKDGKVHFSAIGQPSPLFLVDKRVTMANGNWGFIRCDSTVSDSTKVSDLYIETETDGISIGDFGVIYPDFIEDNKKLYANGLSQLIGAAAVCEALLKTDINCDLTVVFSAQKLTNGRGMRGFFGANSFDKVYTISGCECKDGVKSGCGCAIILKDKTALADTDLKSGLESFDDISQQMLVSSEIYYFGHICHGGEGSRCIGVGIPVSHKDKSHECAEKQDFNECVKLIGRIIGMGA